MSADCLSDPTVTCELEDVGAFWLCKRCKYARSKLEMKIKPNCVKNTDKDRSNN